MLYDFNMKRYSLFDSPCLHFILKNYQNARSLHRELRNIRSKILYIAVFHYCLCLLLSVFCLSVPCFPGYYLQYDVGNSVARRPCKKCPVNLYQDRFGMDSCYKCLGISRLKRPLNGTFNMEQMCDGEIVFNMQLMSYM